MRTGMVRAGGGWPPGGSGRGGLHRHGVNHQGVNGREVSHLGHPGSAGQARSTIPQTVSARRRPPTRDRRDSRRSSGRVARQPRARAAVPRPRTGSSAWAVRRVRGWTLQRARARTPKTRVSVGQAADVRVCAMYSMYMSRWPCEQSLPPQRVLSPARRSTKTRVPLTTTARRLRGVGAAVRACSVARPADPTPPKTAITSSVSPPNHPRTFAPVLAAAVPTVWSATPGAGVSASTSGHGGGGRSLGPAGRARTAPADCAAAHGVMSELTAETRCVVLPALRCKATFLIQRATTIPRSSDARWCRPSQGQRWSPGTSWERRRRLKRHSPMVLPGQASRKVEGEGEFETWSQRRPTTGV